jgi:hypothetical protein
MLFHAVSMKVVVLGLGTTKPVYTLLFGAFANIISSVLKKCNVHLFLNHADMM